MEPGRGRRSRIRELVGGALSLALLLAACTSTAPSAGPSSRPSAQPSASPSAWQTYRIPMPGGGRLSLRYPSDWRLQPYQARCMDWAGPGAIVSNATHAFHNQVVHDGCTNEWAFAGTSPTLVAVDLEPAVVGPAGASPRHHDTRFPLRLALGHPQPRPAPSPGTDVREYVLPIWANGLPLYGVHVWIGPEASAADVALARTIVSTVRASWPAPTISTCGRLMRARYAGHTLGLSDCADLVGLRPLPTITLRRGQQLKLVTDAWRWPPPLPASTDPAVLALLRSGIGALLGVFKAGRPGTAMLVIDHPGPAVCIQQPTDRCVVARVIVRP